MSYESPFTTRLGTNYCPKDEEVAEINALLVEPTLRLERLADEIADMQKALNKLTTERDSLAAYLADHKALISPVRRLPLDIIQEIFVACIPTHRNCVMSASEAPVLLGRICSSWRTISLSTPRLWARLHIVVPMGLISYSATSISIFEQKLAQRLETTTTWLDRSGQCPLSISLEGSGSLPPPVNHSLPPRPPADLFFQALNRFAPRWEHISFTTSSSALNTLCDLTEADVPILKSVGIFQRDHGPPAGLEFGWGRLKMLQGSQISSFSVERNNSFLSEAPLRWDQLTVLSIKGPPSSVTSHMALEIISRCRALRNCAVMVDDHEGLVETQSAHAVVELSFLHTLELSCWGMTTHASLQFLTHLLLPELRNFTLRGYITLSDDGAYPPSLNHFFATPKHLESVSISNTFSKSHLVEMLHSLPPSVQRLQIEETHLFSLDDDGLALLTPAPGRPSLSCPALRELVIYQCRSTSDAAVLQFIAARMAVTPCPTLKRVEVQFARERTLDILPPLRPFIETGELTVAITHLRPFPPQFSPWQGLSDAPANSPPGPWAYDYNDQGFDWDT